MHFKDRLGNPIIAGGLNQPSLFSLSLYLTLYTNGLVLCFSHYIKLFAEMFATQYVQEILIVNGVTVNATTGSSSLEEDVTSLYQSLGCPIRIRIKQGLNVDKKKHAKNLILIIFVLETTNAGFWPPTYHSVRDPYMDSLLLPEKTNRLSNRPTD